MLGRHADAFFRRQENERIVSTAPNGDSRSLNFPDRENAGTGKVSRVSGSYEMPGPQTVVDANSAMPGMSGVEMMPGMGQMDMRQAGMMPGMDGVEMMPGMGSISDLLSPKMLLIGAVVGAGIYFAMKSKRMAS